jgi:dTDP-4-amino-4,6-dideoxygalactose transaminase
LATIPFNKPAYVGKEMDYILQVIQGGHYSGDGEFTKKCHSFLEGILDVEKVLLTTSCTHALEMAALLLNIQPGDEVIVPSFTFVSTINAFVLRGAKPIFVDIHRDTLNMDETQLENLITPRTRVIIPVHYAGVGCEMDTICRIAEKYNVSIVEDNAHGLFGKYKGRFLGTFGCMATQSFHETKNFTCGEGGALIINDPNYVERAEIIREKGTNRSNFYRGQVDKYTWVDIGSSYLPSDILAAFLYAQLESWEEIQKRRKEIWEYYYSHLSEWAKRNCVDLPVVPLYCEHTYHMFYLLLPSLEIRQALIKYLKSTGISSVFHYLPLHLSDMGRKSGGLPGNCPVTEDISDRLLRLPFYFNLTEPEQAAVVAAIIDFSTGH